MTSSNTCRALKRYFPNHESIRAPEPVIAVKDADVVISLKWDGEHDLHLNSSMLKKASHFFRGALRDDWVENKITHIEDPGNGRMRLMKRFELEFFEDADHLLVGKNTATDTTIRILRWGDANTIPWTAASRFKTSAIIAVNELGFAMLCGFPTKGLIDYVVPNYGVGHGKEYGRPHRLYIVQHLLQWIDFYGVLESIRWQLIDFLMGVLNVGVGDDPVENDFCGIPGMLRIATVLRDREFLEWVINKDPIFDCDAKYHLSKVDCAIGLDHWAPVYYAHMVREPERFQRSLAHYDREDVIQPDNQKVLSMARRYWQLMVSKSCFLHEGRQNVFWSILGMLDTFFEDDPSWNQFSEENHVNLFKYGITTGYSEAKLNVQISAAPPLAGLWFWSQEKAQVAAQVDVWRSQAQESILAYLTPAPEEPYGLRLNFEEFWEQYGFPWDYCEQDQSKDAFFSLVAHHDLKKIEMDLCPFKRLESPWIVWSEPR